MTTGVCKINETLIRRVSFILQTPHSLGYDGLKMRSYLSVVDVSGDKNFGVWELRYERILRPSHPRE